LGYDCGHLSDMYCVSLQVLYLGLRLWTSVRYVLSFSSGIVPWLRLWTSVRYVLYFSSGILPWATTVDFGQVCIEFLFRYCTLGYDCGLRSGMYWVSLQVLYLGLRLWTSVRYVLSFSSGIVPWATTVDICQICIEFLFRYCTLGYDCGLRSGMYWVSLQVLYLGLRLWTSVRYVLCFSTGIVPWATTVDFGQVCIEFLFRYCTLGYDCGLRSDMYCVSLQLYFPLGYYSGPRSDVYCGFLQVLNHEIRLWIRSGMYCVSLHVLYLGLRLWTSVRYVLCFSTGILPWATTMDFGKVCIVFLFRYFILDTTVNFGQACIVFPLLYLGYSDWLVDWFQLFHGDQFKWWMKPEYTERTTDDW
jgi:hypothetical protein